jgi:transcriptional regulator with XRE-family HTH domain
MKTKQTSITDQLRNIIDGCGISRYAIAKAVGMDQSAMSRFMSGERGISAEYLDKVGEFLDLRLTMGTPKTKGK